MEPYKGACILIWLDLSQLQKEINYSDNLMNQKYIYLQNENY